MKYLKSIYEAFGEKKVVLSLKNNITRTISFTVKGGKITDIENPGNLPFPYKENQPYNRGMEVWCCNNGYFMDNKDTCPEEKVFGIRKKDIPQGHPLRFVYPNKFR